ncbi:sigma-70 family RNA polymerase sigma factor [Jiangella asiatica]|uniref:Sigma-70 family RNA polymerase sigma factor n=1 Tax=Jiangella asiatica TaxID=2530372 RepID=A0A4R5DRS3_9ACTN|nr:sigma-70 family RNA polymerase sigma factor [Jiangella asiatica]TDE14940.1 sigma-70 family RNA polymerase sigma factor [Jiangella asiatica]
MTTPADAAGDEQLIARTRAGDMAAYDELYRRHVDDASKVARIVTDNSDEAQDVVAEAFTRVLTRLREGGGPDLEFAPYLKTVVRRLAIDRHRSSQRANQVADPSILDILPHTDDPMARSTDRQLVRHAFETLPERWQQVLWHTEIEGRSPASLAPALGGSANSVAALAYRAREGLRQAYLAVNLSAEVQPECRPYAPKIASYVRGTLSAHDTREMSAHLATCTHCRERRDELLLLVSDMRGVLWPALLLPASGVGAAAVAGAGAAGGGVLAILSPSRWGKQARQLAVGGAAAAAAAAIAIAAYVAVNDDGPPDEPAAGPSATSEQEEPGGSDDADPQPTEPPTEEQPPDTEPDQPPVQEEEPPVEDEPVEEEPEPPVVDPPDVEPSEPSDEPTSQPTEPPTEEPSEEPTDEPSEEPTDEPSEPPAEEAPSIEQQPQPNPVVVAGEPVVLTVEVSGNPPPQLQWQFADPESEQAPAQTTAAATSAAPATFMLAPSDAPSFVPAVEGEKPDDDSGAPPDQEPPEENWVDITGENSDTLVIPEPTSEIDGRAYRVRATNPLGTITTEPAVISVQYIPEIESHPRSATADEGQEVTFEATAKANPEVASITWQVLPPGGDWRAPRPEVATTRQEGTTSTLQVTADRDLDGYQYRAVFTNDVGGAISEPAGLTVRWAPEVTEHPADVEAEPGDDAELAASVSGNPESTWLWETAPAADGPWTAVDDATGTGNAATLALPGLELADDGTFYRAEFTNELGTVTTDPAELDVVRAGRFEIDLGDQGTRCIVVGADGQPRAGDCADSPARAWEVPEDGTIRWLDTGRCLDATIPLDAVILAPCDGSSSQQWTLDPTSAAAQSVKSDAFPGFVFDIEQVAPDGRLILFPHHGGVNQQFRYVLP